MNKTLEQVQIVLLKANLPLILLSAFATRLVFLGSSIGEALSLFAFTGLYGYTKYLKQREFKPLEDEVKQQINDLKSALTVLKLDKGVRSVKTDEQKSTRFF